MNDFNLDNRPVIRFAKPRPEEVWRAYINGKIKIRELNSGLMQVAVDDGDWKYVEP